MNERIKELLIEAHKQTNDGIYNAHLSEWTEKFAELIVKECVTIINHGIDHTDYPHPSDTEKSMVEMKAQIWCRDAIKEHFGVK